MISPAVGLLDISIRFFFILQALLTCLPNVALTKLKNKNAVIFIKKYDFLPIIIFAM